MSTESESFEETAKLAQELRLFGLFSVADSDGPALVAFEAQTVWRLLDCMLGGRGAGEVGRGRFSHLDRCLMRAVAEHVAGALTEAFAPVSGTAFAFRDWGEDMDALRPADPGAPFMRAGLSLALMSGAGRLEIVLPLAAFAPVLDRLAAPDPGERLGQDAEWRRHLTNQVQRAAVEIEAVLYDGEAPLAQMRALKPGDSFSFGLPPDSAVALRSEGRTLASGRLGRSGGRAAVRFEGAVAVPVAGGRA